tara:strand:- start:11852 stop:13102 length:1251 start_codon:yes stop_codon:yes gene_type:complete
MQFKFPDVGEGIQEGEIVEWLVKEGDTVKEDQNIVKVETDKAVVDLPAPASGKILKIYHKQGETVKVGEALVDISTSGEKVTAAPKVETKKVKGQSVVGELEEAEEECEGGICKVPELANMKPTSKVKAMPAVRKLAKEKGIDLSKVKGSGKDGRILKKDLETAPKIESKPSKIQVTKKYDMWGYVDRKPLKGMRKAIAVNMTKQAALPLVTHMDEIDSTRLYKLRTKEKKKVPAGVKLTYLPFIIKAVVLALKKHPILNTSLEGDTIIYKKYFNIGIAVATEDGLIVPVIKGADKKSIIDIAKEIQTLAKKARDRKLDLMDLKGSTFTITNVGSIGGLFSTPIPNPGDAAILALGRMHSKAVVTGNKIKSIRERKSLPISLTFDHRILDGAHAALFVNSIKEYLEDPDFLMLGLA